MITLINDDCMKHLLKFDNNQFDLCISDPPYGIGVNSMNMGGRQTIKPDNRIWDDKPPPAKYFTELMRVSKNQIIWGGNYFVLPPSRCFVVWDKGESLYGRSFAECELAWTSFDKSARMFKLNPNQLDRIHPTQKPVKLYEWLLTNYAKEGDKILDTHGGSMSSALACHNMGYDLTLFELDADYFEAGKKRLEQHQRQQRLFT